MYRKIYFTIEMQPIILNTFLVTYEFTGCNLRVGIRRVLETLYRVRTLEGLADSPLYVARVLALLRKMVLEHSTGLK